MSMTIDAVPSGHEHLVDAFAAEGWNVRHVDQHIRDHLLALDPLINGQGTLANMAGGGLLSYQLDERRRSFLAQRSDKCAVVVSDDGLRVGVTRHNRHGDLRTVVTDIFADVTARHVELRRYVETLRSMLPAPNWSALDASTVVSGVDTDAQRAALGGAVRCFAIAGKIPPWATDPTVDLHVIDDDLDPEAQAAAAVAAVRDLVTA